MEYLIEEEESEIIIRNEDIDPIEYVKINEAYCFNNFWFAERYVDAVLTNAVEEIKSKSKIHKSFDIICPIVDEIVLDAFQTASSGIQVSRSQFSLDFTYFPTKKEHETSSQSVAIGIFSGWPKVSEFNIKYGLEKLEEYIETWERSREWICNVEFLGFESEENSNYFVYEVEFSIPTLTYPIPQATASVYFSLEVSKMVPPFFDRSIEVSYVFESSNVIHSPGKIDFQEKWLKDIIECKINFFKSVTF